MDTKNKNDVLGTRLYKLRTISDIFKFLDLNGFDDILKDDYFRKLSLKTLRVFYELTILWLQFKLPDILLKESGAKDSMELKTYKKLKTNEKSKKISRVKIKKKINESGLMEIASEIYELLDSIKCTDKVDEIFKLGDEFFNLPMEELIKRISVKMEEESFLLNELSEVLKNFINDNKLINLETTFNITEH